MGVASPTVPVGESVWPVLTTPATVGTPAENAEQAETTGAFSADVLSPLRLQASFFYSREDAARFAGMGDALRQNLGEALGNALDAQIVAGVNGLLGTSGLTAPTPPTMTEDFDAYRAVLFDRIDGRYASVAEDVRLVMGAASYGHAAKVYRTGATGRVGESALESLISVSGGIRVSAHVPVPATSGGSANDQDVIAAMGGALNMTAPIWEGVTLLEDPYTKSAHGQITLTGIMLAAVKILRADGFARLAIQLA